MVGFVPAKIWAFGVALAQGGGGGGFGCMTLLAVLRPHAKRAFMATKCGCLGATLQRAVRRRVVQCGAVYIKKLFAFSDYGVTPELFQG